MEPSLEQLFEDFRRTGDPECLAKVFDRTSRKVLRVALHLSADPLLAEDLLQSTFVRTIEARSEYDPSRKFLPWLMGILANEARAAFRRKRRTILPERLFVPPNPGPEDYARARELARNVDRVVRGLPELYREVVVLRLRLGLSGNDIAEMLDREPATVRSQLHRGLRLVQKALPAGLALAALLSARKARGLGAVRESVLAEAARQMPNALPSFDTILPGVLLVTNKSLLGGVGVLLALLGGLLLWRQARSGVTSATESSAHTANAAVDSSRTDPVVAAAISDSRSAVEEVARAASDSLGSLRVSVVWSDGTIPAQGIAVRIIALEEVDAPFRYRSAVTGSDGQLDADGLEPGAYRVEPDRIASKDVEVSAGVETTLEFIVPKGVVVNGRVVDPRGQPIGGAGIWISRDPPVVGASSAHIDASVAAVSDPDGSFHIQSMGTATRVGARARGYAPSDSLDVFPSHVDGVANIELVMHEPCSALRGRVVDASGAPVANAGVLLDIGLRVFESAVTNSLMLLERTELDGTFAIEGIEPGKIRIEVRAPRFAVWTGVVDVTGGSVAEIQIVMQSYVTVSGRITNERGVPLPAVDVFGTTLATNKCAADSKPSNDLNQNWTAVFSRNVRFYRSTMTDAEGRYELEGLAPGKAAVYADAHEAGRTVAIIEAQSGEEVAWSPVIDGEPRLRVRVVDDNDQPLRDFAAYVHWEGSPGRGPFRTDRDGRFSVPSCSAMEYIVRVSAPGISDQRAEAAGLRPGPEEHLIRMRYAPVDPGFFEGTVLDPGGRPVADARVTAHRKERGGSSARTDAGTGHFKTRELVPARYEVVVGHPEYPFLEVGEFDIVAGQTIDLGNLSFERSGRLVIQLKREDGGRVESRMDFNVTYLDRPALASGFLLTTFEVVDGVARSGPLRPGRCSVRISGNFFPAKSECVIRADEGTKIEMILGVAGWRNLRFLEPPGAEPSASIHVVVKDSREAELFAEECERMFDDLRCGLALKTGRYRVEASTPSGLRVAQSFEITDTMPFQPPLEFRLQ